jgi:hypothetical protein
MVVSSHKQWILDQEHFKDDGGEENLKDDNTCRHSSMLLAGIHCAFSKIVELS